MKISVPRKIWTWKSIALSFIIAQTGNSPNVSLSRWLSKLWYTRTMEYYSAIIRNEFLIGIIIEIDLEWIRLSEKKLLWKDHILFDSIYQRFHLLYQFSSIKSCLTLRPHGLQHASLSITSSQSLLKLMSIELVILHLKWQTYRIKNKLLVARG